MAVVIEQEKEVAPQPSTEGASVPPRRPTDIGSGTPDRPSRDYGGQPPIFSERPKVPEPSAQLRPLTIREYLGAGLPPEPIDIVLVKGIKRLYRFLRPQ